MFVPGEPEKEQAPAIRATLQQTTIADSRVMTCTIRVSLKPAIRIRWAATLCRRSRSPALPIRVSRRKGGFPKGYVPGVVLNTRGIMKTARIAALLIATLTAGCSAHQVVPGGDLVPASAPVGHGGADVSIGHYIKHVVVIIQENRSFDNVFQGYPGADTQSYGYAKLKSGKVVKVNLTVAPFKGKYGGDDLAHGYAGAMVDCDAPSGGQNCANDGY